MTATSQAAAYLAVCTATALTPRRRRALAAALRAARAAVASGDPTKLDRWRATQHDDPAAIGDLLRAAVHGVTWTALVTSPHRLPATYAGTSPMRAPATTARRQATALCQ